MLCQFLFARIVCWYFLYDVLVLSYHCNIFLCQIFLCTLYIRLPCCNFLHHCEFYNISGYSGHIFSVHAQMWPLLMHPIEMLLLALDY